MQTFCSSVSEPLWRYSPPPLPSKVFLCSGLLPQNYLIHFDQREYRITTIYEISSSHGGEYEVQICLLGCTAV
jgi:hypothetical protein